MERIGSPSATNCFICMEPSNDNDWLMRVCRCTFSHRMCILRWADRDNTICRVCGMDYRVGNTLLEDYIKSRRDIQLLIDKPYQGDEKPIYCSRICRIRYSVVGILCSISLILSGIIFLVICGKDGCINVGFTGIIIYFIVVCFGLLLSSIHHLKNMC